MKKKRLLIISSEYKPAPGGIGTHAYHLINQLQKLGWEATIVTQQGFAHPQEIADFNASQNYKIIALPEALSMPLLLQNVVTTLLAILQFKPHLIIGTGRYSCYLAYVCAKLTFKKYALIAHGSELIMKLSNRAKKIHYRAFNNANAVVYVSEYSKKIAAEHGIDTSNGYVIYNGADNHFFKVLPKIKINEFKTEQNLADTKVLTTVGTLSNRKGQEMVVRALPYILEKYPNTHYYCIGLAYPAMVVKLTAIATELNVLNHLHLLHIQPANQVLNWINAADVYVLPSFVVKDFDIEGFGISVIEAAFCQKAAVVTNQSGAMESVEDGVTGLVAEMGNPASIAEKIITLLDDDVLRTQMEAKALQRAETGFTWEISVAKYNDLFSKIINR